MVIKLFESDKVLFEIDCIFEIENSYTFSLKIKSGEFMGKTNFCISKFYIQNFLKSIEHIHDTLQGTEKLQDFDSTDFITFEMHKYGIIYVFGQIGGSHNDNYLNFRFEADQTLLYNLSSFLRKTLYDS